jgi:PAS domain S-box-containing protein
MQVRKRVRRIKPINETIDHKQVESALQKSEARFRKILEMIPLPLAYVDQSGVITFRNERFIQITGYTAAEVPTLNAWWIHAYPDKLYQQRVIQKWNAAIQQAIQTGQDIEPSKYRVTCKNGEERIFEISGIVLGKDFLATLIDFTEQKRIEEALRESEERYRLIIEALSMGIVIHVDNQIVYANAAAVQQIGGSSQEQLLGRQILEFVHPDDRAYILSLVQAAFLLDRQSTTSQSMVVEERLIRFDGSIITVEASAVLISYYGKTALMVMLNDITERKQALAALRDSEERLRAFFMSDVMGTLFGDIYGNILMANDAFLNIIGYTREELNAGKVRWSDLTPSEFLPVDEIGIAHAKAHGVCAPYEKQYIRKDGSRVWVLIGFVLVGSQRDDSIAFILDLTDLKQKEDEIRKLNAELEQRVSRRTQQLENANKELEAFAYSVSHDLRAPLRAIAGFSQIISEEYADKMDTEGRRLLNVIQTNTIKMDQLISDLLALSRATRIELKSTRIDMPALVHSVYHEVASPEILEKFVFSVLPLPEACADLALIRQVWTNVLSNAIKYTLPMPERQINVGGYVEGEMVVYYVKDSGVGFDPAYVDKIFGVFQRLHKPEDFEGTGVGLAIVERIIQRHGGRTWAEGRVNQGATIYFSLPRIKE